MSRNRFGGWGYSGQGGGFRKNISLTFFSGNRFPTVSLNRVSDMHACMQTYIEKYETFGAWQISLIINEVDVNIPNDCHIWNIHMEIRLSTPVIFWYLVSLLHIKTILLQNTTAFLITNYDNFYYKIRPFYYKSRQLLQITTVHPLNSGRSVCPSVR